MKLNFSNLFNFLGSNPSEQDCIGYLERVIWKGKSPVSPYDSNSKVYKCANNQYLCKNTGKYFNVKTRTIFENSKIPLRKWFYVVYNFVICKQGISSPVSRTYWYYSKISMVFITPITACL